MDKTQTSITGFLSCSFQFILNKEKNTIFHTSKHLFGSKKSFRSCCKQDIIARINKLTPQSKAQWGKMNVGQMLAHLQVPIGVGLGANKIPRTFIGRIFGPFAKKILYNDKRFQASFTHRPFFCNERRKRF